ncbi:hypothetical protein HYH03_005951 [Edaphochlamys debaryana]|uniref:Uncharacterized protein n=1 Tax=Edaphochlamys debaryana TaxID=47281 RepID=A0A836C1Z2_9CHLO|nr:hypothetical protein HYH03_005951 [Edaphochlamys debaryana]|eukprot:KAG2496029.1 hypothetical protein HYH03_005951 [Edaphochlamys debaryana]
MRLRPFVAAPRAITARPARSVLRRAEPPTNADGPSTSGVQAKEESLERLEASIRGKGTVPRPPSAGLARPIPIRGMTQTSNKIDSQYENMSEWKEGQLFPEGWDQMDLGKRLTELYLGRRGIIFWTNRVAFGAVFVILGSWVIFRFVGPALGLYKLAGDF